MGKLTGKVVIITGGSAGIGKAAAIAFSREGAKLAIIGRNKDRLSEAATICKNEGAQEVLEIVGDVSVFENLEDMINKTVEKFGAIDILINNVGSIVQGSIEALKLEDYTIQMDTNLRAPVFLCKYALPHLKKTKGCIVNISAVGAIEPVPFAIVASSAKAALDHFMKGFAAECVSFGVRVNSIRPALTDTYKDKPKPPTPNYEQILKKMLGKQPLGIIQPEEIAQGILYLCSSPHITGTALMIDGGRMLSK